MQVPKPWYRSYVTAKAAMQQDLFGTNPNMAAVLDLWHKTFGYSDFTLACSDILMDIFKCILCMYLNIV